MKPHAHTLPLHSFLYRMANHMVVQSSCQFVIKSSAGRGLWKSLLTIDKDRLEFLLAALQEQWRKWWREKKSQMKTEWDVESRYLCVCATHSVLHCLLLTGTLWDGQFPLPTTPLFLLCLSLSQFLFFIRKWTQGCTHHLLWHCSVGKSMTNEDVFVSHRVCVWSRNTHTHTYTHTITQGSVCLTIYPPLNMCRMLENRCIKQTMKNDLIKWEKKISRTFCNSTMELIFFYINLRVGE